MKLYVYLSLIICTLNPLVHGAPVKGEKVYDSHLPLKEWDYFLWMFLDVNSSVDVKFKTL